MRAAKRRQQAQLTLAAAHDDARHLAVELAAGRPAHPIDLMRLGLVIEPDETAYRYVAATISQYDKRVGLWPIPSQVAVLITDRRLIVRLPYGAAISLWWRGIVALDVDVDAGRVVVDYGDNEPRALGGPAVSGIAVAAVGGVNGVTGMLRHPGLNCLKRGGLSNLEPAPSYTASHRIHSPPDCLSACLSPLVR
jgi:hypothetical protein